MISFRRRWPAFPSPRLILLLIALGAMTIAGLVILGDRAPLISSLWNLPSMDATPGGDRQRDSAHYRETIRTANDQNITRAEAEGASHLPIPESIPEGRTTRQSGGTLPWMNAAGQDRPIPTDPPTPRPHASSTPDPAPDHIRDAATAHLNAALGIVQTIDGTAISPVDVSPAANPTDADPTPPPGASPARSPVQPELRDAYTESILAQMGSIAAGMKVGSMRGAILIETGMPGRDPATEAATGRAAIRISAGTILYGAMLLAADSVTTSPVVASIESGELAGSRLIGSFTPAEQHAGLIISFRTLVDPQGRDHPINAHAIDGVSGAGAVLSHVDQRLLARYGPILAASFLAGLAQSAATPRTVILDGVGTPTLVREAPTMRDSLHAGVAAAANQAQQDIIATRPRGPRVTVAAGHPIGILMLETLTIPVG